MGMEMADSARLAAAKTLAACRKRGAWSDAFLNNQIENRKLGKRDAALATKLCYGVLQNKTLCDFYISQFCPLGKLEPLVLDVLRLSVYQMVFLTKIPPHAVVHEGVELVKALTGRRAAGLVNAVLRKIAAEKDHLPEPPRGSEAEYLSIKYSHPEWLAEAFIGDLGAAGAAALLSENNREPPLTAQVNTQKTDLPALLARLEREGVAARPHPWLPDAVTLTGAGNLEALPAFRDGLFYIQDAAARCAVLAADLRPGDQVLDACAAPGGKSFAAAIQMNNTGRILACDIHEKKLTRLEAGRDRLGLSIIETAVKDTGQAWAELENAFDAVLADVPCSGFGVIRKKPEIREKSRADIERLPEIQLGILKAVSGYVKPGGTLLYSTCTLLREENEDVIRRFLAQAPGFAPEAFTLPGSAGDVKTGMITLYPHIHETDGFFICKLKRTDRI